MDKTIRVLEERLRPSGSMVSHEIRTGHDTASVSTAIAQLLPESDIVLVFGASAICDIDDVIPSAIRANGGRIEHFGMPVDPGNLMLLGEAGGKPVIGAPGCARSPAENGFDWILQRLIAGRKVTAAEITGTGVGGLLMEIGGRPQPREASSARRGCVAAIVLAAGRSTRMGSANKLLARVDGKPLLAHVLDAARSSKAGPVLAVTGHEPELTRPLVEASGAVAVHNPDFREGLSTSLAAGIRAVPDDCDGAIILLGDMPRITAQMIDRMIDIFAAAPEGSIIMAAHGGVCGNPVLWPRRHFEALTGISGDTGARGLIGDHARDVIAVELGDAAGFDLDTPEALAAAGGTLPGA
jgi:molybdenum cofactor cytidylyltransferase